MTKNAEARRIRKLAEKIKAYRDAAICLQSEMDALLNDSPFELDKITLILDAGNRVSTYLRKQIRAALNDFEKRTNTAVLEFEWPSTVHELQLKRKEAEDERTVREDQGDHHQKEDQPADTGRDGLSD